MESWLIRITEYLLTQSWQIAVLTVAVAVASFLLRNRSAHVRYLLWLVVLAKCLVPPLHSVPLAVLPEEKPPASVSAPLAETLMVEHGPPEAAVAESLRPTFVRTETGQVPEVMQKPAAYSIRAWLAVGWLAGALALLAFNLLNALRTQVWLQRQRRTLAAQFRHDIESFFSAHGLKRMPSIWLLDGISQPFVWGLVRGSIYLPLNFADLKDRSRWASLLGHEISHVMRFDATVNSLQVFAQIVFWFHPFVWWANRKIRAEREKCCDETTVARLHAPPEDYSEAIVETLAARHEQVRPVPSLAVAGPVKNIEERIRTMLRPGKKFYKHPGLVAATVVLLTALVTVPSALVLTARAGTEGIPTPLHQGVSAGDIERVKSLLSKGVDVNAKDDKGQTALYAAVLQARIDLVLMLAANGADLGTKDKDGRTGLSRAATSGLLVAVVRQLLALGADPNIADESGETALHHAARNTAPGGTSIIAALVAKGADINAKNNDGRTPAHVRIAHRKGARLQQLLELGADLNAQDKDGNTVLHLAIERASAEEAEHILAKDRDINQANNKGQTPLHLASRMGRKKLVEGLIRKGANLEARDNTSHTALHIAAVSRPAGIAGLLVDNGASIDAETERGHTPAYLAIRSFNSEVADQLIKKGADTSHVCMVSYAGDLSRLKDMIAGGVSANTKDEEGFGPLHAAAVGGRKEIVEFLLSAGADPKEQVRSGWTALGYAIVGNHMETVRLLRAKGIEAGAGVSKLLPVLVWRGYTEAAKQLIALGADVNANNGAALYAATEAGHKDMVELLVASNANVNLPEAWPPLRLAIEIDRPDIAACLIDAGADVDAGAHVDTGDWTPLMQVPYRCKGTEMIKLLIDAGANVNKRRGNGWTALNSAVDGGGGKEGMVEMLLDAGAYLDPSRLHQAAWYSPSAIKVLVAHGADVNARNWEGYTPLHFAFYYGLQDSVRQLVALGADINARTYSGETILHLVPTGGSGASADFCEFLLSQGAEVNARDNSGWTPLHRAAFLGEREIVDVLLANGADAASKTNDSKTPSDLAKVNGHTKIVELLKKHGAKE